MDFLDPRLRRAHRRRLMIGYVLMGIVVGIATLLIVYLAYGYDIDRKTGNLIQNGIVFVDSNPRGARVYLNDVQQSSSTDLRLALPAGVYTIRLERDNYRTWERTFNLRGGEIERLVYPYLIPNDFVTNDVYAYDVTPALVTQSLDRRWVLVQKAGQTYQFDLFDLDDYQKAPTTILLPLSILTEPTAESSISVIEWSSNNRHVLIKRSFNQSSEYLLLDRESPNESINLNVTLGISPAEIRMRNKRQDQFYYLDASAGTLRIANTRDRTLSAPIATGVIDYRTYGDDMIIYVTYENTEDNKASFRIIENNQVYTLRTASRSDKYILEIARYEDKWYFAAGSNVDDLVSVYRDPIPALKAQTTTPLIVAATIRLDDPKFISLSENSQFIMVQSGNKFLSLDLEDTTQYRTSLTHDILPGQKLEWMDAYRLLFTVNGQSYIIDFDGSNEETLVTSKLAPGPFFDRDYNNVYTFEDSKSTQSKQALTRTIIED